jgi:hypothetical protein
MKCAKRAILVAFCLLMASPAAAKDVEAARALFNAGANAYAQEKYLAAIQAFEQAYELSKRSGLLFSIAQSYRRQYFLDQEPPRLQAAVDYYERYLQAGGERRAEASQAAAELRPMVRRLREQAGQSPDVHTAPARVELTQLSVNSPTPGARLILDGRDRGPLPFIEEVEPGTRKVKIVAPGYQAHERAQRVPKGELLAVDVGLDELPAQLTIRAEAGANVMLDGRLIGPAPVASLGIEPGSHFVTVSQNGAEPFTREIELGRDERLTIDAELPMSSQRVAAWSLLGAGVAGIATGGVFGLMALSEDTEAGNIQRRSDTRNITLSERADYLETRNARDDLRLLSWVGFAAGGTLAALGGVLYIFDEPRLTSPTPQRAKGPAEGSPSETDSMEIGIAPTLEPGGGGASVIGRF